MEKRTEKRFHLWMSWDYEKEERWINQLSQTGLHLEKVGPFWSRFVRDDSIRYTYRMDYQPGLYKKQKMDEYISLYRDAGWEYKSTYGGMWHYFRRVWEPEAEYQLYTDRASLKQHYKRIQNVMGTVFMANAAIFFINMSNLLERYSTDKLGVIVLPIAAIYLFVMFLLGYGYIKMGKKVKSIEQ